MKKLSLLSILLLLIISSCKKNETILITDNPKLSSELKTLEAMGFKREIIDKGDYYIVEDDIIINKKSLEKTNKQDFSIKDKTSMQAFTNIVSSNIIYINVGVDETMPTSGVDSWTDELITTLNNYNDVRNLRVKFNYVSDVTQANIIISSDVILSPQLPNSAIASAVFPTDTYTPGHHIYINLDFDSDRTISSGTKIYNLAHELGHCLGLRHTNYLNDPATNVGANLVEGTRSEGESSSIMNGGTANYSWNGFSVGDKLALRTKYPTDAGEKAIFRYNNSSINRHLMTTNWSELGYGTATGFLYESIIGYIYNYSKSTTLPLYRWHNSSSNDYYYTTSSNTVSGYSYEGITGYVYSTNVTNTIPLYQYFSTNMGHFYTTNYNELGSGGSGWTYEGIKAYVLEL